MMVRFPAVIFFLFALQGICIAVEYGVIRGRVYDSRNFESLPLATVISSEGPGTAADESGNYLLKVAPGNITLSFSYVGYVQTRKTVFVSSGDTVVVDAGLEPDFAAIDQIVISAGKAEQRLSELTVSVNIIKPDFISSSHINDPAEMINKTSGIEVLDGQASIRGGSGFSYGAGSRVLALIDGLPVLSADAGNIKWQFMPMENISQVEIIKGASSVMYGSSALNGVINFRTADAGNIPVTRVYIESGVFDKPRNREWIWWRSPRSFHSTSFSHIRKTGNTGLSAGLHLLSDNGYRKANEERLGRVSMKISHQDRSVQGLSYGVNLNSGFTGKTDFILWENASAGALKQSESTANRLNGMLLTIDPFLTLERDEKTVHNVRMRLQLSQNIFPEAGRNNSNALSFFSEYHMRYLLSGAVSMNFGVTENFSRVTSALYGDHGAMSLAGYTQADITASDRIRLVAGIRLEYNILDGEGDILVPLLRTGLNYRLSDYTFLRASYGQGYRYPSIAEKFAATTLGSIRIVPNPRVMPEKGWSAEVGLKQGVKAGNMNGQVDLALFYLRNTDMIEYLFGIYPDHANESFSYGFKATNVEQSRIYGVEVEFGLTGTTGRFSNSVRGGYVFTYPIEFDPVTGKNKDEFLKYRRKHSVKLNLESLFGKYGVGLNVNAGSGIMAIDEVFLNELTRETILPGFYDYWNRSAGGHLVIDPFIGYSINDRFRVSVVVKNILNAEYMGRPGDIMPHRNYSIRLAGSF